MSMDVLKKLLTVRRGDGEHPGVFIRALGEIPIINYTEDYSRRGHTITLTLPADIVEFDVPVHPADAQA
jgi:hypothetical protein